MALLLAYIALAALSIAAGDRIGALFCLVLRKRCGGAPLLHLPGWMRAGVGLAIPVVGLSGVIVGAMAVYGPRTFWVLTNNLEILSLLAFFIIGILTSIYVGGFCSRH